MNLKKDRIGKVAFLFLEDLDEEMAATAADYLKREPSPCDEGVVKTDVGRAVFKVELGGRNYYIKKFANKKTNKVIKDCFRPEPGVRNFRTLVALQRSRIRCIRPVLAAVDNRRVWNKRSLCVTAELRGTTLQEFFLSRPIGRTKEAMIDNFVTLYAKLLEHRFYQMDPNLKNFMVEDGGIAVLDVDLMKRVPFFHPRIVFRNMVSLNRWLMEDLRDHPEIGYDDQDRRDIVSEILHRLKLEFDTARLERTDEAAVAYMNKEREKDRRRKADGDKIRD